MDEELLISLVQQYKELYDLGDPKYHDEQRRLNIWEKIGRMLNETPANCREKWKKIRDNYRRTKKLRKIKSGQAAKKCKPIRYEKALEFLSPYIEYDAEGILTNLSDDESMSAPMSPPYESESQVMSPPYESGSQVMSPASSSGSQVMSPASSSGSQMMSPASATGSQVKSPASATGLQVNTKRKRKMERVPQTPTPTHALFQSYLDKKYQHNITAQQSANQERDTIVDFFTNLGHTVKSFPLDLQIRIKGAVFKIVNDAETEVVQAGGSDNLPVLRNRIDLPTVILSPGAQPRINSSTQPLRIFTQNQDKTISAQGSASTQPLRIYRQNQDKTISAQGSAQLSHYESIDRIKTKQSAQGSASTQLLQIYTQNQDKIISSQGSASTQPLRIYAQNKDKTISAQGLASTRPLRIYTPNQDKIISAQGTASTLPLRIYTQNQDNTISAQGSASTSTFQPTPEEEYEIQDSDNLNQFLHFPNNKK